MLDYAKRALRFVGRNLFRNTRFFLGYALHFFDPGFRLQPRYYDEAGLLARITEGKSLIRLGDGEVYLMNYGSIHYQPFNPRLRDYLLKMVREYGDSSPYLLGIPQEYLGRSNEELKDIDLLHCWLPFKVTYRQLFNTRTTYFDAHLFYRNNAFARTIEHALAGRKVILVTSEANWQLMRDAGMQEKLDVTFVACPAQDAFSEFDALVASVRSIIGEAPKDHFRVVASAGPASKALVYELSKEGIVSYDLGRGIEAVYRPVSLESSI